MISQNGMMFFLIWWKKITAFWQNSWGCTCHYPMSFHINTLIASYFPPHFFPILIFLSFLLHAQPQGYFRFSWCIKGWKHKSLKCYWVKKPIEHNLIVLANQWRALTMISSQVENCHPVKILRSRVPLKNNFVGSWYSLITWTKLDLTGT